MRTKDESKFKVIANEIKSFMIKKGRIPSQRELAKTVGLGKSAVCRYLKAMKDRGLIEGTGREIATRETQLIAMPIVDSLRDSRHVCADAKLDDFVFVSHKIYGDGEFGIVRAIDDSMSQSNININNLIVIRRQSEAGIGQIVLVKANNKFYLRRLAYDAKQKRKRLLSESKTYYEEIRQFEIRGVVVSIVVHLEENTIKNVIQNLIC